MHKHSHVIHQAISNTPEVYMIDAKIKRESILAFVQYLEEELLNLVMYDALA